MSKRDKHDDDEPVEGIFVDFGMLFVTPGHPDDDNNERCDHDGMIEYWESLRETLTDQFGKMTADDIINLQRVAKRACVSGHHAFSRLVLAVGALLAASGGNPDALDMGTARLVRLAQTISFASHIQAMADAKAKAKAKAARGKAKAAKAKAEAENLARGPLDIQAAMAEEAAARCNGKPADRN